MPRARAKRSGRFTYGKIKGNVEKEIYLRDYYKKHQKVIDNAVQAYKARKNITKPISSEDLFVNELKYGRDFGSTRQAKAAIERHLVYFRGEDENWYDAKHGSNSKILGDLRKLNKFKPKYNNYTYMDLSGDWGVDGYYETNDPDIIIANKVVYPSDDSPYSYWEYMYKDKVGL